MIKHTDTLIIGGGISGLSCAWWLAERGVNSILLEQAEQTGGLIDSTDEDGYVTDHSASMLLNFDQAVDRFITTSGLLEHKILRNKMTRRCLVKNGRLVEVPIGIRELIFSNLLSRKARRQLMSELFSPPKPEHWESVADFIRRRLGQEILELAIDPYVSAVLACDPEKACASATLPRLSKLERQFGSFTAGILLKKLLPGKKGLPQEVFSFAGGMKTLVEVLTEKSQTEIQTRQQVVAIESLKFGWLVSSHDGESEHQFRTRHLILATPADVAASLLRPLTPKLSGLMDQIEYAPIAQIHLGFDRSAIGNMVPGSGFLVPSCDNIGIRGSLWMSNLIDNRAPDNKVLTSNYIGGACQPGALGKTDNELVDQTLSALKKLCGIKATPEMARINRHRQGLPLYHGKYARLTQSIITETSYYKGLHLVANFLEGISIRDRIIQAKSVADAIHASLSDENSNDLAVDSFVAEQSWSS